MKRATPNRHRLLAALAIATFVQVSTATYDAHAQTPAPLNVPKPLDDILRMVYDGLRARDVLGFSYDDAKKRIPEFAAKFAAFGRDFQKLLDTGAKSVGQHIAGALTAGFKALGGAGQVSQAETGAGPFDAALKAVESVTSGIDSIRREVFELLNPLKPPTSPSDAADTKFCAEWLRKKAEPVFDKLKGIATAVIPPPIIDWARDIGLAKLAEAGAPFLVLIRFVRGKIKEGIREFILIAMESTVNAKARVDKWLNDLHGMLPPPLKAIIPKPDALIKTIRPFVASALDTIGRATGAIASYLLSAFPTIKQYAKILGDTLVNVADAASAGVSAFLDGTAELMPAKGKKIDPKRVGASAEKFNKTYEIDANVTSKDAPLPKAMRKLMEQIAGAVQGAMRPMLEQVSAVVNFGIGALFNVFRKTITTGLRLIPEAGGIVGGVFNVVTGLALNIFMSTMSALVMETSLAILKDETVGQYTILVDIWTNPKSREKLTRFRQVVDEVFPFFEDARKALHAAKAGFEKGAAALFEGPLMDGLLSKLPFGWGGVIQPAVSGALEEAFAPEKVKGGFQFDLAAILRAVMERLRSFHGKKPLRDFLMRDWPAGADPGLKQALIDGIAKAWDTILAWLKDAGKVGDFLNLGGIRRVVGEFVKSSAPGLGAFLAKGLDVAKLCGGAPKAGSTDMQKGVTDAVVEIGRAIADEKDNAIQLAVMKGGFDGLIPILAQAVMRPLGELMACRIELPDIRAMFQRAIDDAGDFFADPFNLDLLKKNGFPAFFALAMKLFRFPIGQFMASGFGDPLLAGDIAETINRVYLEFMKPDFFNEFLKGGFGGITFKLAGIFQAPVIGWFSRGFPDKDFGQAAAEGYSDAVKPVDGKSGEVGVDIVLKKGLFAFLKPILRKVYRELVEKFDKGLLSGAQARLVAFADGFGRILKPLAGLKTVAAKATDAGRSAFKSKALPCDKQIQLRDAEKSAVDLADCVYRAGEEAFASIEVAGLKQTVIEFVKEIGKQAAERKKDLTQSIRALEKIVPAAKDVVKIVADAGAAATDAARKRFVDLALKCAEPIDKARMEKEKKTIGDVAGEAGNCLVAAAQSAFAAGAVAAMKKALVGMVNEFGKSLKDGQKKVTEFISTFGAQFPSLKEIAAIVKHAEGAAAEHGRTRFVWLGRACAGRIDEAGVSSGEAFTKLLQGVAACLVDAAKSGFAAGAVAGLRVALVDAVNEFGRKVADGRKKLLGFSATYKAMPGIDGLARIGEGAAGKGLEVGRGRFVRDGKACAGRINEAAFETLDAVKGMFGGVTTCLVAAAANAAKTGAASGLKSALLTAIEEFRKSAKDGIEKMSTFIQAYSGQSSAVGRLAAAVDRAAGKGAEKGRVLFVKLARPCANAIDEAGFATAQSTVAMFDGVAKCLQGAADKAFKAGGVAAMKSALFDAIDAFEEAAADGRERLQAFIDEMKSVVADVVRLDAVLAKAAAAQAKGARHAFVRNARLCVRQLPENGEVASLGAAAKTVVDCLVEAGERGFKAEVVEVVNAAIAGAVEGIEDSIARVRAIIDGLAAQLAGELAELKALADALGRLPEKAGNDGKRISGEAKKCLSGLGAGAMKDIAGVRSAVVSATGCLAKVR